MNSLMANFQLNCLAITIFCAFFAGNPTLAQPPVAAENWIFLDNNQIRIGVNLDAGGAIGWFSKSRASTNLLNSYDHGRFVQQSYYGDVDGSQWNGKPWRFNPVQGGSWEGQPAEVLEKSFDNTKLYIKTHPRNWAGQELMTDVTFEQTISLESNVAKLAFKMQYHGDKAHKATHQELPAMFVNPILDTLHVCDSSQTAWTNAKLTELQPGFPNEQVELSEPWAAWTDNEGDGIGMLFPHSKLITTYRVKNTGIADCSYLAPIQTFSLTSDLVYEYEAYLTAGKLDQIRERFKSIAERSKQ